MEAPKPSDIITPDVKPGRRTSKHRANDAAAPTTVTELAPAKPLVSSSQQSFGYHKFRRIGAVVSGLGLITCGLIIIGYMFPSLSFSGAAKDTGRTHAISQLCKNLVVPDNYTASKPCKVKGSETGTLTAETTYSFSLPLTYVDAVEKLKGIARKSGYSKVAVTQEDTVTAVASPGTDAVLSLKTVGHIDTSQDRVYPDFTVTFTDMNAAN